MPNREAFVPRQAVAAEPADLDHQAGCMLGLPMAPILLSYLAPHGVDTMSKLSVLALSDYAAAFPLRRTNGCSLL